MNIISLKQNTDEWLDFRRSHIGASDAPIIMEESPWYTPDELLRHKAERFELPETSWMRRGKMLESRARSEFEHVTDLVVFPCVIESSKRKFLSASLDGITPCLQIAVEIKCPGVKDHLSAVFGDVPKKYNAQLQHQMLVAQLPWIYYFSFDGTAGTVIKVDRDDAYIKKMLEKELIFWELLQKKIEERKSQEDV